MNNMMEYKGFSALIQYSSGDEEFVGRVINAYPDRITFGGKDVKQLKKHMKEMIDSYLEWAEEEGVDAKKPYSGRITFRTDPKFHADLARAASLSGKRSINAFIGDVLSQSVHRLLEKRT